MFRFSCMLSVLASLCLLGTQMNEQNELEQAKESVETVVEKELGQLMGAPDSSAVFALVYRWKAELSENAQKQLIIRLVRNLSSMKQLPRNKKNSETEEESVQIAGFDFFTEKGRSALALSWLFQVDLSPGLKDGEKRLQQFTYEKIIERMKLPYEPLPDLKKMSVEEKIKVASEEKTPEHLLNYLAYDTSVKVRLAAAKNRSTDVSVLGKLLRDPDPSVRAAAKENLSYARTIPGLKKKGKK